MDPSQKRNMRCLGAHRIKLYCDVSSRCKSQANSAVMSALQHSEALQWFYIECKVWQTQCCDRVDRAVPLLTRMLMLPLPFHAATASGACTLRASSVCLLVSKPREAASASLQIHKQSLPMEQLKWIKRPQSQHNDGGESRGPNRCTAALSLGIDMPLMLEVKAICMVETMHMQTE